MLRPDPLGTTRVRLHVLTALLVALALAAWEVWAAQGTARATFFPPPTAWLVALEGLWTSGTLSRDLAATGRRFGVGMATGIVGGWVTGLVLGSAPRSRIVLDPIVAVFHPLPKISLYPLLLLLLGFGAPLTHLRWHRRAPSRAARGPQFRG